VALFSGAGRVKVIVSGTDSCVSGVKSTVEDDVPAGNSKSDVEGCRSAEEKAKLMLSPPNGALDGTVRVTETAKVPYVKYCCNTADMLWRVYDVTFCTKIVCFTTPSEVDEFVVARKTAPDMTLRAVTLKLTLALVPCASVQLRHRG
jgi:hypothetical protein